MIDSRCRDEVREILARLEFEGDEGAYVEGEHVFVQIVPVSQPDGRRTLEIRVGSYGVPAEVPAEALNGAAEAFHQGLSSENPAVRAGAETGMWQLSLPRARPGDTAGVRVQLRRKVGSDWSYVLHPPVVTNDFGRCRLKDVRPDATFRLDAKEITVQAGPIVKRAMTNVAGFESAAAASFSGQKIACQGTSQEPAQPLGRVLYDLPYPNVAAVLTETADGGAELTIEADAPEYDGAAVVVTYPDQAPRELVLQPFEDVYIAQVRLTDPFAVAASRPPQDVVIQRR